jgi:2-(1,2-epoxy-1,2-dihydrophenyl)acetyl-CoA isomerase
VPVPSYHEFIAEQREAGPPLVQVEREGTLALVRMDDPGHLNALSAPLTLQVLDALTALDGAPEVRTIVLTGTDPAFSAGGDLRLMEGYAHPMTDEGAQGSTAVWRWIRRQFGGAARLIASTDKAVVAAVNGPAAGVALAWALTCDLVVASERARLVPAFGRIGLVPEVGSSWALTRRLGYQGAFALFASGRELDGQAMFGAGLATEVVPHDGLLAAARAWGSRIDALPEHVVPMMKPLLRGAADQTWDQAIAAEEFAEPMCFTTDAHRRAVRGLLGRA